MDEDKLTKVTYVPNWMISLVVWIIGAMGIGASGTISALVWWALDVEGRVANLEGRLPNVAMAISNFENKLDRQTDSIQQLQRDVEVIKAREKP